ncbi:MAG: radical SAM protein [Deltaproteobacteria bacterium]|nr:radical SAM protein [Deltaproteobacteria bacterium]
MSLGVDLLPEKTCTYDCLYCQIGKTRKKEIAPCDRVPIEAVLAELRQRLEEVTPDTVTLSGSGEPTLHPRIGEVISRVKKTTGTRVAVLTNGSLLWRDDVRRSLSGADLIMPTFSTAVEKTFRAIHRPHRDIRLAQVVEGLGLLRKGFRKEMFVEVMLLRGFNDSDREIETLRDVLLGISPDRIQLNTVVRPPADPRALPIDRPRMEELKNFLGPAAEVIADSGGAPRPQRIFSPEDAVLEMAGRRPVRVVDIVNGLHRPVAETESAVNRLVRKGLLELKEHGGESYYSRSTGNG